MAREPASEGAEPPAEHLTPEEFLVTIVGPTRPSRARRVLRDVARAVSTVFNPFIVPLALFVLLCAGTSNSTPEFLLHLGVCAAFTSIVPMLCLLWLYATE